MRRLLALALGLCLCASPALAAFTLTFVQTANNDTGSVHSISTPSLSISAGTLVVVTGDMLALNNSADSVFVTDTPGNTYTVYQCPETAGSLNVNFVAYSKLTSSISSGVVAIGDTTTAGTNIGAGGAMWMYVWTLAGADAVTPEDAAVRACNGSTSSTTSPTVTSGTPSQAGDYFLNTYMAPQTASGFTYTADTTHGWAIVGGGVSGTTRQAFSLEDQTNAGSGTKIANPVTTSAPYATMTVGFKAAAAGSSSYGGGTTVGVGH